jgi:hypothetical protein
MYRRYAVGLRGYLRRPLSPAQCAAMVERQRSSADDSFLRVLEHGVYDNPRSPYRPLLEHAGIEHGDVAALVRDQGLEDALQRLYDAGVHIRLSEVKGRSPVERPGLEFRVGEEDFDNPMLLKHFEARSGGSRSAGKRTVVDLAHLEFEAAQFSLFCDALGLTNRPAAAWYPAPPGYGGIGAMHVLAKLGRRVDRWFSQTALRVRPSAARNALLAATAVAAGKAWGRGRIPWPEHVPLDRAETVARWLAEKTARGEPGMLLTYPSAAVRACAAALEGGLDIAGSFFYLGGEPFTAEKARVVERAGGRAVAWYGMTETGSIAIPCGRAEPDEVHLLPYKVAVIQRPTRIGPVELQTLLVTTLLPHSPKLLLNIETGDYGVLEEHDCDCALGQAGLRRHLRGIRSHEKLTTAGMTFLGDDVLTLIDEVLPRRYGGGPEDYQLVEEEGSDGMSHVTLVVSPRLGELPDEEMIETVFGHLSAEGGVRRMMAEVWRGGHTVRVARRQPYVTAGGKVMPLHLLRGR